MPVLAAIGVILGVGFVAEDRSRKLARETQRTETSLQLEALRTRLETAIADQLDVLSRLAGALAATPNMSQETFDQLAASVVDGQMGIRALAAAPFDGAPLLVAGPIPSGLPLADLVAEAGGSGPGARSLPSASRPALLLWSPVSVTSSPGSRRLWGHTTAIVETEVLFENAGLRDQDSGLDVILTAAEPGARTGARALHLGHAGVLADEPVALNVSIPGGEWTLAARPKSGWTAGSETIWPIRALMFLSAGLVAVPMLRTRRLVGERQTHINELRDREARLLEISQRLRLALDASRVAVWDYNIDRDELIWDRRMDELYGYPHDAGHRLVAEWQHRLHPDDRPRAEAEFRKALHDKSRYNSEFRVVLEDGHVRHIRAIAAVYTTPEGQSKIVGVNWDVSAEVLRNAELEARRAEAEAALAAKSQFLATMSHEIRTPMNGIIGMLDLLLRENLTGPQRTRAAVVRDSARHLLAIVNDVLDFSKLEADRITLEQLPVNIGQMAGDTVSLVSAANDNRNLRVFASVDGLVPDWIRADPTRLRQILSNLLGNAVKFTASGTVELRLGWQDRSGGILNVSVRDTGVGIPEEAMQHIFDRYHQADATITRSHGGTGLGLAICKQLVECMGGEIAVQSMPGHGSTFRFWIPAPRSKPADGSCSHDRHRPIPASAVVAGARILVAESDPSSRQMLSSCLEMAGHEVAFAGNGPEAVRALQGTDYDLLIMDTLLPQADGLAATREIRALGGRLRTLPIIGLIGDLLSDDRDRCLAAGMTDCIEKPVSVDVLFSTIERAASGDPASRKSNAPSGSEQVIPLAASRPASPGSA